MTMISREEQWHKRIDEYTSSGFSIQEWCKVNTISSD
ncbi:IS66 family insertion sequence element accessory protein TnpA [Cellulosilyticum sp. ST5]